MFMTVLRLIAALVLLMQTAAPAPLTLTVTDATGARVTNATVLVSNTVAQRSFMTGPEGTVELRDLAAGEWTVMIRKEGFLEYQQVVTLHDDPINVPVTLEVAGL